MSRQTDQARWIAVLAATAIALYICWLMLRPFISVLEWAIVLVIVFHPIHMPSVLPLNRAQSEAIIARTQEVVSASVYGVVTIAGLQGFLGGIAFWLLGLPSPILWAVLMAFVCMIPIAGSFLVWLPLAIYLMASGHWTKAVLLVVWGALVVSTVDNFLRPKLIRNQTRLHELFIFFSVLGGISVFGVLGIVLGPVVLAITFGLLQTFQPHGHKQLAAE